MGTRFPSERGMLTLSRKEMRLYFMQKMNENGGFQVNSIDLERLFQDSEQGDLAGKDTYETVHGQVPADMATGGDMALDGNETHVYFKTLKKHAAEHLPEGMEIKDNFGPRNIGAGPGALASLDLKTGEIQHIITAPFQVGHVHIGISNTLPLFPYKAMLVPSGRLPLLIFPWHRESPGVKDIRLQ